MPTSFHSFIEFNYLYQDAIQDAEGFYCGPNSTGNINNYLTFVGLAYDQASGTWKWVDGTPVDYPIRWSPGYPKDPTIYGACARFNVDVETSYMELVNDHCAGSLSQNVVELYCGNFSSTINIDNIVGNVRELVKPNDFMKPKKSWKLMKH
uniref:C-type lectin domain-containing protein n=1 Tax=Acrobeloides nanus TaxID=290746 RepID=A0A914CHU6_9BILA